MPAWVSHGSAETEIGPDESRELLEGCVARLPSGLKKVLLIPPDFTRFHSDAGTLTCQLYEMLAAGSAVDILPAIGTHRPMSGDEIARMFPGIPQSLFKVHDWRGGLSRMGTIPGARLAELSGGRVDYDVAIEIDPLIAEGGYDAIISIGQIVPHEVAGLAGGNKNILVGTAGPDTINKSHFLGAVCNMETIMGNADTPVRALFNEAEDAFLAGFPIVYVLNVRSRNPAGNLVTRGLFVGRDRAAYAGAAALSRAVNIETVAPLDKVVVYLDPEEFKSTWLGNKAIYRTRMAIADDGELLVLAPGLVEFGEAEINEKMIRRYGYCGTDKVLEHVAADPELRDALGAAAHLIHGSSEGRFKITYASGGLTQEEIESVHYAYTDLGEAMKRYDPKRLTDGFNTMPDGEQIFYISNPALGLWKRG
ncbi:MAG: DUF2088 domain-containing protein [Kiritimatiellae bacterium]|nr:DUF2088 domain-containing protein [Kiritimatiellia bacterium]